MKLLYDSIKADGFTMPIVCYYAKSRDMYVIVDNGSTDDTVALLRQHFPAERFPNRCV